MKLRLLFIIIVVCSFKSYGQGFHPMIQKTLKAQKERVKEHVKVEKMFVFPVDEKGKVSKKGSLRSEIHYNEFGKQTQSSTFFPDMSLFNENEYDQLGNLIKTVNKNGSGKVMQTMKMLYGSNNGLVKIEYYNSTGQLTSFKEITENKEGYFTTNFNSNKEITLKTITKIDSLNKTVTTKSLSIDNQVKGEDIFKLSDDFLIIEWSTNDNIQNKKSSYRFKYDENGNEVEKVEFDINGNPTNKFMSTYNENNLLIESIWHEPIDKMKQVSKYEYTY